MEQYCCGDDVVEVKELREIRAIAPGASIAVDSQWLVRERIFRDRSEEIVFEGAGWRFVYLKDVKGTVAPNALKRIYQHGDGRLSIFSGRLAVRFDEAIVQISEPSADLKRCLCDRCDLPLTPESVQSFAPSLYNVQLGDDVDPLAAAEQMRNIPGVVHVEPEMLECVSHRQQPDDLRYRRQWQWNNTGDQVPHSQQGADVKAPSAWNHATGQGIRLAVIDSGMDVEHPDLSGALYRDVNGILRGGYYTYDANGIVGFEPGLDQFPPSPHGTACAGMALARSNSIGVRGIAYEASLIPVATVHYGLDSQVTLARAIRYAADSSQEPADQGPTIGADIVSVSLGPNAAAWPLSIWLQDAIDFAVTHGRGGKGTPIFWSVSNVWDSITGDRVLSYPSTIAVGKTNAWDVVEASAHGAELDFVAPGVEVHTTVSGGSPRWGNYLSVTGTSFAAPCAAGIAALILQSAPDLTWQEVRQIMRDTCDKVGQQDGRVVYDANGHHPQYGYGRLNAYEAAQRALALVPT